MSDVKELKDIDFSKAKDNVISLSQTKLEKSLELFDTVTLRIGRDIAMAKKAGDNLIRIGYIDYLTIDLREIILEQIKEAGYRVHLGEYTRLSW